MGCTSKKGCTDSAAIDFDPKSRIDDNSCNYAEKVVSFSKFLTLKSKFNESSGVLCWAGRIWTFNDGGNDPSIYSLDTSDGSTQETIDLNRILNTDFEDITQNDEYVFVGDVGNNNGNRTDLVIHRFKKGADTSIKKTDGRNVEQIYFSYSNQTDFRKDANNSFDCEAMVYYQNGLFLFSKDHKNLITTCYSLLTTTGNQIATPTSEFNVNGLVTGADISPDGKYLILTGYHPVSDKAFLWIFSDWKGNQFFTGKKRQIDLGLRANVGQIEGVGFFDNQRIYLTNELYGKVEPRLYQLNMNDLIQ